MLELIFFYIQQKINQGYDSHFLCVAHCIVNEGLVHESDSIFWRASAEFCRCWQVRRGLEVPCHTHNPKMSIW
jgi:hypothetical protein